MAKTWKEVVITPHLLGSNKNVPKDAKGVKCSKCLKFIKIGEKAMRHRRSNNAGVSTKYYCVECFEGLWI